MAQVSLQVPGGLADGIRETVLLLYRAAVEALHLAFGAQAETGGPLEEVRRQRERLTELGRILDQLGWPGETASVPLELAGRRDVVSDILHGSVIDAGERLAVACGAGWRGEASTDSVRAAAREVIALDRLLRELEASEGR
jgi:hypothetical protein